MKPNEYTPERAASLKRWKRNRDHTNGNDSVKGAGTAYLPRDPDYSNAQYDAFKQIVPYFPAAARTLQSFVGLIFRKSPKLIAPTAIEALAPVLTASGDDLEALAKWTFSEYCITNDGGLLVDHPETPKGLTKAQAAGLDIRPYIAAYAAEAILEVSTGVINGRKRLIKVRLLEDAETVRQLEIIDGVYTIVIFKKVDDNFFEISRTVPLVDNAPMKALPFIHLADGAATAPFDELCAKNLEHYVIRSLLADAMKWISKPITITTGLTEDVELKVKNGMHWSLPEGCTAAWHEYKGDGVPAIERELERLAKELEILGSRMLASEKVATGSESTETVARRNAGEESILGAMARHVASKLLGALKIVTTWSGQDANAVSLSLNTDFVPTPLAPQMLAQISAMNASGLLPNEAAYDLLQAGEMLPAHWTYEVWAASRDTAEIDPPAE